jgi:hypothetical protein
MFPQPPPSGGNCVRLLTRQKNTNSYSIIIGLIIVVIASVLAYFFSPKGETQTFVRIPVPWLQRVVAD